MLSRIFKLQKIDFIDDFLEQRSTLPYISVLTNLHTDTVHGFTPSLSLPPPKGTYLLFDLPGYFKLSVPEYIKATILDSFNGSIIYLSNYKDLDDYNRKKLSSKRRSALKNYEKRLRYSLEITDEVIYGTVTKAHYDFLFSCFKNLLQKRFDEKRLKNYDLENWDRYRDAIYPLILKNQACISVIYHNSTPICFSVNVIHGNTLYGYFKSYDINYSKFSLGFIEMNLLLKWAFTNNIELFDLLKGHYEYKTKLIDDQYTFKKVILYNKKSFISTLQGKLKSLEIKTFYRTVSILKVLKLDLLIKKVIQLKERRQLNKHPRFLKEEYLLKPVKDTVPTKNLIELDMDELENSAIRKALLDFLFSNKEKLVDLKVYSLSEERNTLLVKGKRSSAIISRPLT